MSDLITRFSQWFKPLSDAERNAAFRMTSGLADAMAREMSPYAPERGFLERYVNGEDTLTIARHEYVYGSYREHVERLAPPFTPLELGAIGRYAFLEPFETVEQQGTRSEVNNV